VRQEDTQIEFRLAEVGEFCIDDPELFRGLEPAAGVKVPVQDAGTRSQVASTERRSPIDEGSILAQGLSGGG
jgi:hypothetical protein